MSNEKIVSKLVNEELMERFKTLGEPGDMYLPNHTKTPYLILTSSYIFVPFSSSRQPWA